MFLIQFTQRLIESTAINKNSSTEPSVNRKKNFHKLPMAVREAIIVICIHFEHVVARPLIVLILPLN